MTLPQLKRIRIDSIDTLRQWLAKNDALAQGVMLVTRADASHLLHVTREQVQSALSDFGWVTDRRYTLNASFLGHAIRRP